MSSSHIRNSSATPPENQKEAVKTYIEQTKVLISLASTFVVAPAAAVVLIDNVSKGWFVVSELAFVVSVLAGYVVFATIAGNQHKGFFNVHDPATRVASLGQIAFFILGLLAFISMVYSHAPQNVQPPSAKAVNGSTPVGAQH